MNGPPPPVSHVVAREPLSEHLRAQRLQMNSSSNASTTVASPQATTWSHLQPQNIRPVFVGLVSHYLKLPPAAFHDQFREILPTSCASNFCKPGFSRRTCGARVSLSLHRPGVPRGRNHSWHSASASFWRRKCSNILAAAAASDSEPEDDTTEPNHQGLNEYEESNHDADSNPSRRRSFKRRSRIRAEAWVE